MKKVVAHLVVALLLFSCTLLYIPSNVPPQSEGGGTKRGGTRGGTPRATTTIAMQTPTPEPSATICTGYAQGHVNVRACGSTRCRVLTTLPEGAAVEVLTERNGWIRIADGWIYGKFICR